VRARKPEGCASACPELAGRWTGGRTRVRPCRRAPEGLVLPHPKMVEAAGVAHGWTRVHPCRRAPEGLVLPHPRMVDALATNSNCRDHPPRVGGVHLRPLPFPTDRARGATPQSAWDERDRHRPGAGGRLPHGAGRHQRTVSRTVPQVGGKPTRRTITQPAGCSFSRESTGGQAPDDPVHREPTVVEESCERDEATQRREEERSGVAICHTRAGPHPPGAPLAGPAPFPEGVSQRGTSLRRTDPRAACTPA